MSGDTITGVVMTFVAVQPNPCEVEHTLLATVGFTEVTGVLRTIPATAWEGTGPYHADISVPDVTTDTDLFAYVDHSASVLERVAEANAGLFCSVLSANVVRVQALGIKPSEPLPMIFFNGGLGSFRSVSVPATAWQGSGPWTASVSVGSSLSTAFAGVSEQTGAEGAAEMSACGIHVSAISGTTVTLRAIVAKPGIDLVVGIGGV